MHCQIIRSQSPDAVKRSPHIISRFPRQPDDQIGIDGFDAAVPYQVIGPIKSCTV